jgi:hypothetical protein
LETILSEVLADLAFMFSDDEVAEPMEGQEWLETTICYDGPSTGALTFRCTRGFSLLLAGNLLGIDPDQGSDEDGEDAVKEFMNIVCGQLVTAWHGVEDIYNLSIPKIKHLPEAPTFRDDDCEQKVSLSVEEHLVQLLYTPGARS